MEATSRGYPIPEEADYAANYLQLERLALAMDADLHAQYLLLQQRLTAVGQLKTSTGTVSIPTATPTDVTSQMNSTIRNVSWTTATPFDAPSLPGSYLFGAALNLTTATATANTERRLSIVATIPTGLTLGAHRTITYITTCNATSQTAGDFLSVQGMFDIDYIPVSALPPITISVTHYNAANMTMNAGALMWCFRVSNGQS